MDIQRIHAYDFNTAASYANAGENGVGSYSNGKGLYPYNGTSNGNLGEEFQYDQVPMKIMRKEFMLDTNGMKLQMQKAIGTK